MTSTLTRETIEYIAAQFSSGAWEPLPLYMGNYSKYDPKSAFAVHKSLTKPGYIAFYDSAEKAEARRETIMKPGKFLRKYWPSLDESEIRELAERYAADNSATLAFATTPDEIARVYIEGPRSCMSGSHFGDTDDHPAQVYGAGDLAVAHIGSLSRALCWPEKKIYGEIYGDTDASRNRLSDELEESGYTYKPGGFEGARLLKIPYGNKKYLMPYLDNALCVLEHADHFRIDYNGYPAQSTNGAIRIGKECEHCGGDFTPDEYSSDLCARCEENTTICECCESRVDCDETTHIESEEIWVCESCIRHYYTYCEECDEYHRDENVTEVGNASYCEDCLRKVAKICPECDKWLLKKDAIFSACGDERLCSDSCKESHESEHECGHMLSPGDLTDQMQLEGIVS